MLKYVAFCIHNFCTLIFILLLQYFLPWEHFISIDAPGELASQLSLHPCSIPKSLQPPEHDNHVSLLKHFPILIASFSRALSVRITWPVEYQFENNFWQNSCAPKSVSQKWWPQMGDHVPSRNTSGNLPSFNWTAPSVKKS